MTLDELNEHLGLLEDLEATRAIRDTFMAKAKPGAAAMTGMPHSSDVKDKVGDLAVEIADLDTQIETLEWMVKESEKSIVPFIGTIRDNWTRMIFRLRFLRGLSWGEVAGMFGRRTTEESVKKACYRYLEFRAARETQDEKERENYEQTLFP